MRKSPRVFDDVSIWFVAHLPSQSSATAVSQFGTILAAAIYGGANIIVTMNLRDFIESALAGFGIEAMHPDMFIFGILDNRQSEVVAALHRLRNSFKNPPHTAADLSANMKRPALMASADALGMFVDNL